MPPHKHRVLAENEIVHSHRIRRMNYGHYIDKYGEKNQVIGHVRESLRILISQQIRIFVLKTSIDHESGDQWVHLATTVKTKNLLQVYLTLIRAAI